VCCPLLCMKPFVFSLCVVGVGFCGRSARRRQKEAAAAGVGRAREAQPQQHTQTQRGAESGERKHAGEQGNTEGSESPCGRRDTRPVEFCHRLFAPPRRSPAPLSRGRGGPRRTDNAAAGRHQRRTRARSASPSTACLSASAQRDRRTGQDRNRAGQRAADGVDTHQRMQQGGQSRTVSMSTRGECSVGRIGIDVCAPADADALLCRLIA